MRAVTDLTQSLCEGMGPVVVTDAPPATSCNRCRVPSPILQLMLLQSSRMRHLVFPVSLATRPALPRVVAAIAIAAAAGAVIPSVTVGAQTASTRFPVIPAPLEDAAEIALARSAAPAEISDSAEVVAVRAGTVRILRRGSSGAVCMVSRDLHEGSSSPICFNPEGARTALQRELLRNRLRSLGVAEDSVDRAVAAAVASGAIPAPTRFAIAYMTSSQQVLFTSPGAAGVRIGAWYPHVMIYSPHTVRSDVGLARAGAAANVIQLGAPGTHHTEIVFRVPRWSDGTPAPPQ